MPIGVYVTTSEAAPPGGVAQSTGTAFFAGKCDKGSGLTPTLCQSINDYVTAFGDRSTSSATLYDAVDCFFREGGTAVYVLRVTDNTATTAALTLNDQGNFPSVVASAASPGLAGNNLYLSVSVANATATFTATTTSASTTLSAISSFLNIGPGTPVSGTGIPTGAYLVSTNPTAGTAVLSSAATAAGTNVALTPTNFTILVADPLGNALETHGPYVNTAALYADTTSTLLNWSQSTGGSATTQNPKAVTSAVLTGGGDATDLTDASAVTTLAAFSPTLGPGTVALPGYTSATAWNGLLSHAQANNRFAAMDLAPSGSAATLVASIASILDSQSDASYGEFNSSPLIVPGLTPGTTRTVPGSAFTAALRAQVAVTGNDNQQPAGINWPLTYSTGPQYSFSQADMNSLNVAGINPWAIRLGVLCKLGFVTPVSSTYDAIFWQANAVCERMALVSEAAQVAEAYLFQVLDGQQKTITAFGGALSALINDHWSVGALYGDTAVDAGAVIVAPPVNTAATAQAGQLNASLQVRISPAAQTVNINIEFVPITQTV